MSQERPGISNVENSAIEDDHEPKQHTISGAPVPKSNNTEQTNSAINSSQLEEDSECLPPQEEAKQENKHKRRRVTKQQDGVLDYLRERDKARQSVLKNIPQQNDEDEISSFATHIKNVLKTLPPLLQIKARQEVFQVLIKYEIMAVEAPSPSTSTVPNYSTLSQSASRPTTSMSSHSMEFEIYSPTSNCSESNDLTHQTTIVPQETVSIVQVDELLNNYPNCSGDKLFLNNFG